MDAEYEAAYLLFYKQQLTYEQFLNFIDPNETLDEHDGSAMLLYDFYTHAREMGFQVRFRHTAGPPEGFASIVNRCSGLSTAYDQFNETLKQLELVITQWSTITSEDTKKPPTEEK